MTDDRKKDMLDAIDELFEVLERTEILLRALCKAVRDDAVWDSRHDIEFFANANDRCTQRLVKVHDFLEREWVRHNEANPEDMKSAIVEGWLVEEGAIPIDGTVWDGDEEIERLDSFLNTEENHD